MGEWYQTIVDKDATDEEAEALASSVIEWLISEGIIEPTQTDCVLGDDLGYPPGPNHRRAADAGLGPDYLYGFGWNGMHVVTGRSVFYVTGVETELICSACAQRCQITDEWHDAVSEWYEQQGPGILACPHCGYQRPITKWQHDPPWGFGYLGFKFWNWPTFETSFIEEVSKQLGHKVVVVEGKL